MLRHLLMIALLLLRLEQLLNGCARYLLFFFVSLLFLLFLVSESDSDDDSNIVSSKASPKKANAQPHLLAFYPKAMTSLIPMAKAGVYRHMVLYDAFPEQQDECFSRALQDAIQNFANEHRTVEPSKTFPTYSRCCLNLNMY